MTVITSGLNAYTANSVAPTITSGATGAVGSITTAKTSPTITRSNSTTVTLSRAAASATSPASVSISDAVKAYKAALASDPPTTPSPVSIKDTAANLKGSLTDLETMVTAGVITGIALSDAKAPTLGFARSDVPGVLSDTANADPTVKLLQKITSSFVLNVTEVPIAELATLKAVSKTSSLTMAISGTADEVTANLKALQTAAKAKTLSGLSLTAAPDTLAALSVSASDLTANADALGLIKGAFALKVTNVAAADTSKVITAADKLLKTASTANGTSMIDIKDTAANLVANIKALETLAVAGRIGTITVSDGKALVLTGAQIAAATNVLNEDFTSQVSIEATNVAVDDVAGLEAKIEDNSRLTLTKVSVADKAAAIQTGIDGLEAVASAWKTAGSSGGGFALANIAVSDKGTLTLAQSKVVADIDALSVLSGPYTLKVTDITVAQALAIKAPSKDATLSLAITDTTTAVAGSIDKLAALVKSKTLASLSLTDATSKALTLTSAQLSANGDTLKLVQSDYKLAVTDVLSKDVATVAKAKNLYSITIKDTLANVLAGMKTLTPLAASAKIASVALTDKAAPTLSIADAFTLKTTLPNVTLPTGIKPIIADTASNVIAHARYDVGDILSGASKITLTDKTAPNLTLADAKTLKALPNLDPKTKYNVADGGNVIAAQAALSNETVLSGAAAVYINKNFSIAQAKAVTGIKTLDKGTVYSINDTADNILAQAAIKSETVLAKANAVNVVDTSTNILAKLDQLEALAKAGKIADITFTDAPTGVLAISSAQMLNDAEAIGKIISQRTLPTVEITKPKEPGPIGLSIFNYKFPSGTTSVSSYWFTPGGKYEYGNFADQNGLQHFFIVNTQNKTFKDIFPQGTNGIEIKGFSNDKLYAYGSYLDVNNKNNYFIINFESGSIKNIEYKGAIETNIIGFSPDETSIIGYYTDTNNNDYFYTVNLNEENYTNFNLEGAKNSQFMGFSSNKSKYLIRYQDFNNVGHLVTINTNVSNLTNLLLKEDNVLYAYIDSLDDSKLYGQFLDKTGNSHGFIINIDGSNFVDLNIPPEDNFCLTGFSSDGLTAYGQLFVGNNANHSNNDEHAFVVKFDGSNFKDLTPNNVRLSQIINITNDSKKLIGYAETNNGARFFSTNLDGSDFTYITTDYININKTILYLDNEKMIGSYYDYNGMQHNFIAKIDGTDFKEMFPNSYTDAINSITSDNRYAIGYYIESDNTQHSFVFDTKLDLNVTIKNDSKYSSIDGVSLNGKYNWGSFVDQNDKTHLYVSNIDGTNIVDVTPNNAVSAYINNITPDGSIIRGHYIDINNHNHGFTVRIDGTQFVDLTPNNSIESWITGFTPNKDMVWGQFLDENNQKNAFISRLDGTGFVNLTPDGAIGSTIYTFSSDKTKAQGQYQDLSGQYHAFIVNSDGSGFIDMTPKNSTGSGIRGFISDGTKVYGRYKDLNARFHYFISNSDGTGFIDLTPSGIVDATYNFGFSNKANKFAGVYKSIDNEWYGFIS